MIYAWWLQKFKANFQPIHAHRCVQHLLSERLALRALSTLRGLRGAPAVPPLGRETQSLGQQMLNATVGVNGLRVRFEFLQPSGVNHPDRLAPVGIIQWGSIKGPWNPSPHITVIWFRGLREGALNYVHNIPRASGMADDKSYIQSKC